jgi:hypothetical protein
MKVTGMCVSAALMTLWFGRRATHKHIDALLRPEIAGVRGDPIDVSSMIDQRPLGESARAAIQAELNLRFEISKKHCATILLVMQRRVMSLMIYTKHYLIFAI